MFTHVLTESNKQSLTLHQALKEFRQQENQKKSLVNKLKMFKMNQQKT